MEPVARLLDTDVLEALASSSVCSPQTLTMEEMGQRHAKYFCVLTEFSFGFILYETIIQGPLDSAEIVIQELHDRALIFLDGEYQGVADRPHPVLSDVKITVETEAKLQILVENQGRINFGCCAVHAYAYSFQGPYLQDFKGITHGVRLPSMFLFNWTIHSIPLDNINLLPTSSLSATKNDPTFFYGTFSSHFFCVFSNAIDITDTPYDTFIDFSEFSKGVVWINGFNLGRYWPSKGPQQVFLFFFFFLQLRPFTCQHLC